MTREIDYGIASAQLAVSWFGEARGYVREGDRAAAGFAAAHGLRNLGYALDYLRRFS